VGWFVGFFLVVSVPDKWPGDRRLPCILIKSNPNFTGFGDIEQFEKKFSGVGPRVWPPNVVGGVPHNTLCFGFFVGWFFFGVFYG